MANYTDITDLAISHCRQCGSRIAWLKSRTGKPYPVNAPGTTMRVARNAFHTCRVSAPAPAPAPAPKPVKATPAPKPVTTPDSLVPMVNAITGMVLSDQEMLDLRRAIVTALDVYCVSVVRHKIGQRAVSPANLDEFLGEYQESMAAHVAAQVAGIRQALNILLAETEPETVPEPDNAAGPEPIPGDWTPSDEDVPF